MQTSLIADLHSNPDVETGQVIKVAVPRPLHATYDYLVPLGHELPAVGARLTVPFGPKEVVGVCVENKVDNAYPKLKPIKSLLDADPIISEHLLTLAQWMSDYYHYPLGEVLSTLLPAAARKGAQAQLEQPDVWQIVAECEAPSARAKKQLSLYLWLKENGPASFEEIKAAGFERSHLRTLSTKEIAERATHNDTADTIQPSVAPLQANPAQQTAISTIVDNLNGFNCWLLEGVTGSGKTEVFMQAMQPVVAQHKQVLVLVPEIALTPQTLARFTQRFAKVGMQHSQMTDHERFQTWLKCAQGKLNVLIGTRSSVFTEFANLGLIIVDEEHDSSYKQQEGLRYSARDLAAKRAHMLNIPVVLGSATPSLESLHNVDLGRYRKLQLPLRAGSAEMPSFHLIDMRGQNTQQGISIPLQQVIKQHLAADNQVLVFLNRRGFAPTLLCTSCGWQAHCSDCDARLTLHQSPPQMSCHHCGLHFPIPNSCESCHAKTLTDVGVGTQKIEAGLSQMFSGTPIYRVDRDTIRTSRQLDLQLQKINAGASAILVGTQMLAKGHHFPNVTLVAILNADSGFCSPDFRAPERTAQTIVQVAGRAGRAEKTGQVWIQSYQPENPTLQMLINAGYPGFAEFELSQRKLAHFPPFQPMSIIRAESPQAELAQQFLTQVQQTLKHNSDCEILGPVPAPLARQANRWRYQLLLLANNRQQMHQTLQRLDLSAQPRQVRWSVDVDPYDSL